MNSEYRKNMDLGNPLFLNKTPRQILRSISVSVDEDAPISERYDEFIMEWMADLYTYIQWKYNVLSSDMIKKIKPDELYLKYHPLHEASIENGAEKLRKMYQF